jgi:pimeloyl-ACP methyl ester carboxylesterase
MPSTNTNLPTFVLIPGAWMGGWVWEPVAAQLRKAGHTVHAPTLAGLTDRDRTDRDRTNRDRTGDVGLETHVEEILALLDQEDITGAVLVGHSYSGLVAGQVADRRAERVAYTVFVQAFLPRNGRSLIDDWSHDPAARQREIADITARGGLWEAPIAGLQAEPDLSPEQRTWLASRLIDHPGRTVTDAARMTRSVEALSATYIASLPDDAAPLPPHVAALSAEPSWTVERIRAGHWPMVSVPAALTATLRAAAGRGLR